VREEPEEAEEALVCRAMTHIHETAHYGTWSKRVSFICVPLLKVD